MSNYLNLSTTVGSCSNLLPLPSFLSLTHTLLSLSCFLLRWTFLTPETNKKEERVKKTRCGLCLTLNNNSSAMFSRPLFIFFPWHYYLNYVLFCTYNCVVVDEWVSRLGNLRNRVKKGRKIGCICMCSYFFSL